MTPLTLSPTPTQLSCTVLAQHRLPLSLLMLFLCCIVVVVVVDAVSFDVVVDRFSIALFSALEQTHCARV